MSHIEFKHGEHTYRAGKLPAMTQLHVTRRLAPVLTALLGGMSKGEALAMLKTAKEDGSVDAAALGLGGLGPLVDAVAALPDEQVDYVITACLSVVERKQSAGGWAQAMSSGQVMFEDIDMAGLLAITRQVLQHNLAGFFGGKLQDLSGALRT